MKTTRAALADGRELIYFDHDDAPERATLDRRDLPEVSSASELRWDPLLREWVMMASHRQARTFQPPVEQCPLCPSRDGYLSEVPADDYGVVVFENRFPSLSTHATAGTSAVHPLVEVRSGLGRCEVVCFSSDHDASFADLSVADAGLVVEAWVHRTAELSGIEGVEQVFCFESRGEEIGVTLSHPHGQVYAYPFVTPRTARMRESALAYRQETGADLQTDLLRAELEDGARVVAASDHWAAFVPAAARWPVEVHLYPRRRVRTLAELDAAERVDLAEIYLDLLNRFDRLYDRPLPYIAAWHQGVVHDADDLDYLHLELFSIRRSADKLKYLASSESGMGAFITDSLPEATAQRLRDV